MVGETEVKERPKSNPDYLMQLMNDRKVMSSLPNFSGIFTHLERLLDEGKVMGGWGVERGGGGGGGVGGKLVHVTFNRPNVTFLKLISRKQSAFFSVPYQLHRNSE